MLNKCVDNIILYVWIQCTVIRITFSLIFLWISHVFDGVYEVGSKGIIPMAGFTRFIHGNECLYKSVPSISIHIHTESPHFQFSRRHLCIIPIKDEQCVNELNWKTRNRLNESHRPMKYKAIYPYVTHIYHKYNTLLTISR